MGGRNGDNSACNDLSALHVTLPARFQRLPRNEVLGTTPPHIYGHCGWHFEAKLYFLGSKQSTNHQECLDNILIMYDIGGSIFSTVETTGAELQTRTNFSVALLADRVYVTGGETPTRDFVMIDMKNFECTKIATTYFPRGIDGNTLVSIEPNRLLHLGGTEAVMAVEGRWDDDVAREYICRSHGFLHDHETVCWSNSKGWTVLAIGGSIVGDSQNQHPRFMSLIDINST